MVPAEDIVGEAASDIASLLPYLKNVNSERVNIVVDIVDSETDSVTTYNVFMSPNELQKKSRPVFKIQTSTKEDGDRMRDILVTAITMSDDCNMGKFVRFCHIVKYIKGDNGLQQKTKKWTQEVDMEDIESFDE